MATRKPELRIVHEQAINPYMLKLARDLRGLTSKELAKEANIKLGKLYRYLNGKDNPPPADELQRLADCLDMPVSFFYRPGGDKPHTTFMDGENFHAIVRYEPPKKQPELPPREEAAALLARIPDEDLDLAIGALQEVADDASLSCAKWFREQIVGKR